MFASTFDIVLLLILAGMAYGVYRVVVSHGRWFPSSSDGRVPASPEGVAVDGNSRTGTDSANANAQYGVRRPRDTLTPRVLVVALLAGAMLVPLAFVKGVVSERGQRYHQVLADIGASWGSEQTVIGPILVVPYTETEVVSETVLGSDGVMRQANRTVPKTSTLSFLPAELRIDATLDDEIRRRGIFRSLVYTADMHLEARFEAPSLEGLPDSVETIHWDRAWLSVGLGDTRSISEVATFNWDDEPRELASGTRLENVPVGIHASLPPISPGESHTVSLSLTINGSGGFQFAPVGEQSTVTVRSDWPHPTFHGSALPTDRRIDTSGFEATWSIPHLARNYPQRWSSADASVDLYGFVAGVTLFEPVSLYSQIDRSAKYGVLFVALTFVTLLVFEIGVGVALHVVQYALVGIALSLFYLVLLSVSEHLAFGQAYVIAASLMIAMISVYTGALLRNRRRGAVVALLLGSLYGLLYVLLQLEDYALLLGTVLLVAVVMVLMGVTRNLHRRDTGSPPAAA